MVGGLPGIGDGGNVVPSRHPGLEAVTGQPGVDRLRVVGGVFTYVGCEHLLLGLVAEPDGVAGQVLRGLGAEPRLARRAVVAALAGYVHLRGEAQQGTPAAQAGQTAGESAVQARLTAAIRQELQPFVQRLERLEERLSQDA
ncbi:hypothetical protein E1267_42800 [Nonomuraea longispora]|uniref:Clp R domain-containing protein n=1 Tax=Nonomuraea longispora TaxID=1848320 RepID=A0A4R4MFG3_9ACTN|nr:hypothetical protein E1267_42800 [Nonomuraea longispora]